MATATVTLRPATSSDAPALAELIVQLYGSEVPDGLGGPRVGHVALFQYLIAHELHIGLTGRFLAVDASDTPLGSASFRLWDDPLFATLPPRFFSVAFRALGFGATLRLFWTTLRSTFSAETPLRREECFCYSVVVAETERGRGIGTALMLQLEEQAQAAGARVMMLRVMVGNTHARQFYHKLGYRVLERTPPWADWISTPSELLRKEL